MTSFVPTTLLTTSQWTKNSHLGSFRSHRANSTPPSHRHRLSPQRMCTPPTSPTNPTPLTYASSGVDIDKESSSVKALISALGKAASPRSVGTRGALVPHAGGFSGLLEFGDNLLALCTDGVGSKLLLAEEMSYYESIALDCVAMNVNDLLCVGAEPLGFVDYIAAPHPDAAVWAALGRSLAEACRRARVSLCGGETATLPDMVRGVDMSGTALGWLPRGAQLDGSALTPGDVIIGLPSSGVHSNGFSLVRSVLAKSSIALTDPAPFELDPELPRAGGLWRHGADTEDVTLGEVLLNPTYIYVDPVVDLLLSCRSGDGPCDYELLHGIVHVTGGGLSNLLRLGKDVGYEIDNALPVPPEFAWVQTVGAVSDFEMWRTFNMGMGLCIMVDAAAAVAVRDWLAKRLPGCAMVGHVTDSGMVRLVQTGVTYEQY